MCVLYRWLPIVRQEQQKGSKDRQTELKCCPFCCLLLTNYREVRQAYYLEGHTNLCIFGYNLESWLYHCFCLRTVLTEAYFNVA
jgi:hypothetical protein